MAALRSVEQLLQSALTGSFVYLKCPRWGSSGWWKHWPLSTPWAPRGYFYTRGHKQHRRFHNSPRIHKITTPRKRLDSRGSQHTSKHNQRVKSNPIAGSSTRHGELPTLPRNNTGYAWEHRMSPRHRQLRGCYYREGRVSKSDQRVQNMNLLFTNSRRKKISKPLKTSLMQD